VDSGYLSDHYNAYGDKYADGNTDQHKYADSYFLLDFNSCTSFAHALSHLVVWSLFKQNINFHPFVLATKSGVGKRSFPFFFIFPLLDCKLLTLRFIHISNIMQLFP
jgi:hypothetical protein